MICRLEGYQCQSDNLEELVELTEKTHKRYFESSGKFERESVIFAKY